MTDEEKKIEMRKVLHERIDGVSDRFIEDVLIVFDKFEDYRRVQNQLEKLVGLKFITFHCRNGQT